MDTIALERAPLAAPAKSRLKLNRKTLALAGLALALTIGGIGYGRYWWTTGRFIESTDDAYVGGNVTPVAPHVAGFVAQILVADNQYVRAGQMLMRLDARDFRAALDHARAVATERHAALTALEAKHVLQQAMIREAEANLDARLAQATFAAEDAVRYRDLALTSYGTRQNAERSSAADAAARSATQAAQADLTAARQQLAVLDAEIAEAHGGVAQAEADVETARLDLGYTEIRSPIDGYVGNRAAQLGAYVARDAYLVSVIPAYGLWVDANFKEDQLAHMRAGQPATVVADVLPDKTLHGHILSLAPGTGAVFSVIPPENATGNFTKIVQRVSVRIGLDDARLAELRPGLSTTVSVDTKPGAPGGE
ncbi:MAG: HlyD family secretion protein [Alphaproteobacteria bacterium]|nr:HlyD family secretion protein [Alphaproteobacteria bacterium]